MKNSLLSILTDEERLMRAIDSANRNAQAFREVLDSIRSIPVECDTKTADLAHYEGLIAKYQQEADENRRQLDAVRDDLKAYITELFKKEIDR